MLVLTRRIDESIIIGDNIEVSIIGIKGDKIKIGITAPANISVHRKEVYIAIKEANIEASSVLPDDIVEKITKVHEKLKSKTDIIKKKKD